jgi:hypothetical protein
MKQRIWVGLLALTMMSSVDIHVPAVISKLPGPSRGQKAVREWKVNIAS